MNNHNGEEDGISHLYIDLAKLLQRGRPPEKARKIERVLESGTPVLEMIAEIERIDAEENYRPPAFTESEQDLLARLVRQHNLIPAEEAQKNLSHVKNRIERNGLTGFILSDFIKIIRFAQSAGRKNDLLRYTYIPPRIRPNRRLQQVFETGIQKQARDLVGPLKRVLTAGWRRLTKLEYNLVARFYRLCAEILSVNFRHFDLNDEKLVDRVRDLELYFISCVYRQDYPAVIIDAVGAVIEDNPEWKYSPAVIKSNAARLLAQKQSKPSLYNLILVLNMVKYRRHLAMHELIRSDGPEIVNTVDYDCEPWIKKRIREYLDSQTSELSMLLREKQEIDRITRFLPAGGGERIDMRLLERFYDSASGEDAHGFEKDGETPVVVIRNFFARFLEYFEALLVDRVDLYNGGQVRVFSFDYFQYEVSRIRLLMEKLDKYRFIHAKVNRERYFGLASSRKTGTQTEIEMMQILGELVSTLKAVVMKLVDIDRFHQPGEGPGVGMKPLEPAHLISRAITVPCWDREISAPAGLRGQQVLRALQEIGIVGTLLIVYTNDGETMSLLKKKDIIQGQISVLRATIERIATCVEYKKICDLYGI